MKASILKISAVFSLLFIFVFTSCDNDNRPVNLSEDPLARENVFEQILNDEELFREFMNELRENDTSLQWMTENRPMMSRMYGGENMHRMMRNNPQMRDSMMQGMFMGMESDSSMRPTPQMRERMLSHMRIMMERDTAFARELQEIVQEETN